MFSDPRILHIDDDEKVRENVRQYLEGEEIPDWGAPTVVSSERFEDALACLEAERFDVVILDVRLGSLEEEGISVEDESGVRTLEGIRARRFVPIIFWTGLPGGVAHLAEPLVSVLEKTQGLPELMKGVCDVFATRLPAVNRALRLLVEDEQRRYMWEFVAQHWQELEPVGDYTAVAYLLARRLARSISGPGIETLARSLGGGDQVSPLAADIHPVEMYIQPPIAEAALQVGDLLKGNTSSREGWWVVLTPSCDILNKKAEYVLLAEADPLDEHRTMVDWRAAEQKGALKAARKEVEQLVSQRTGGQSDRWLFLPAAINVPDLVVDMQRLASVSREGAEALEHVASLDSPFAEEAVNRFSRYYGRIGTPNFDSGPILDRLKAEREATVASATPRKQTKPDDHRGGTKASSVDGDAADGRATPPASDV